MEMRDTLYFVSGSLGMENFVLPLLLNMEKKGWEKSALENRGDHRKKASGEK